MQQKNRMNILEDATMTEKNGVSIENNTTKENNRKIRVGIIGCGGIARAHVNSYKVMPDVEIVAGTGEIIWDALMYYGYGPYLEPGMDYSSWISVHN